MNSLSDLVNNSLTYPLQNDTFLRTVAIGGLFTFLEQVALRALLTAVEHKVIGTDSFLNGSSMAVLSGLMTLGLVSFIFLSGFYVRITKRVIDGEETLPEFSDTKQLMFNGGLFCGTLLAIVVVVLTVQLVVFLIFVVFIIVAEAYLGVPSISIVLFTLWMVLVAIPVGIMTVYPQPSIWILIAKFSLRSKPERSYFRFVVSRQFFSELGSILLSRKYVSSWAVLVVVSILQGAATFEDSSLFLISQPVDLLFRINTRFASAVVGFYVSVAIVYIFAVRFRDPNQNR